MSIVNTVSGGEPIPEYAWIEYQVNTNSWTTTEYVASVESGSYSEEFKGSLHLPSYYGSAYSDYSVSSSGEFVLSGSRDVVCEAGTTTQINLWVYGADHAHICYLSHITTGEWYTSGKRDKINFTEYYDQKLNLVSASVPHTSTTVDWNTIVKIHLTEQTGEQFKKYPLVK